MESGNVVDNERTPVDFHNQSNTVEDLDNAALINTCEQALLELIPNSSQREQLCKGLENAYK